MLLFSVTGRYVKLFDLGVSVDRCAALNTAASLRGQGRTITTPSQIYSWKEIVEGEVYAPRKPFQVG